MTDPKSSIHYGWFIILSGALGIFACLGLGRFALGSGYFSDRYSRKYTLAAVFGIQTIAFLLAGLGSSTITLYCSVFCFGIVAWCVPSIMAVLCSDYAGPVKAVTMFSAITLIFAAGQITGPFLTGLLAQATGTFSTGYVIAAILTIAATILSTLLPSSSK